MLYIELCPPYYMRATGTPTGAEFCAAIDQAGLILQKCPAGFESRAVFYQSFRPNVVCVHMHLD